MFHTNTYVYARPEDIQVRGNETNFYFLRTGKSKIRKRLEAELRAAKSAQLAYGEVSLPPDLLHYIASNVIRLAECEPCGLRNLARRGTIVISRGFQLEKKKLYRSYFE